MRHNAPRWRQVELTRGERVMEFQRILELCDIIGGCGFLPTGNFYVWARANAIRQIQELYTAHVGVKYFVSWPSGVTSIRKVTRK